MGVKKSFLLWIIFLLLFEQVIYAQGITCGIRISFEITEAQTVFTDSVFDYVMTPFLSEGVRNSFQRSKLFLYRSIQGTWENFNHFDWTYINQHENMFCHTDSANQCYDTRITTKWSSFLMEAGDLVEPAAQDALSHWINYFAVTSSQQVHAFGYDGLFIDSASHLLKESWLVNGILPWNYTPTRWRYARYNALKFIKSYFPDKIVVFNGLHSGNGADSSLGVTDGGMWEDFAYDDSTGEYKGINHWLRAVSCMHENRDSSKLILVIKKPGLINDMQARIFSVASYLLIANENTVLTLSDYAYDTDLQYYPEFDIDLGEAASDLIIENDTLFSREFENGLVIVNPSSSLSKEYELTGSYYKIVPQGGGFVFSDGSYSGRLTYEIVEPSVINLPPVSAVILKDSVVVDIGDDFSIPQKFELSQNYPNPFNPTTTIKYSIPANVGVETQNLASLRIYNVLGEEVATLVNQKQTPGNYAVQFNANNLPSGVYFYTLRVGDFVATKKMILLK